MRPKLPQDVINPAHGSLLWAELSFPWNLLFQAFLLSQISLDITLLFSSYVYLIFYYFSISILFMLWNYWSLTAFQSWAVIILISLFLSFVKCLFVSEISWFVKRLLAFISIFCFPSSSFSLCVLNSDVARWWSQDNFSFIFPYLFPDHVSTKTYISVSQRQHLQALPKRRNRK